MRVTFLSPKTLTPSVVQDSLSLVLDQDKLPTLAKIGCWSEIERLMVYDWAIREHLVASDGNKRIRRTKPWLLELVERD